MPTSPLTRLIGRLFLRCVSVPAPGWGLLSRCLPSRAKVPSSACAQRQTWNFLRNFRAKSRNKPLGPILAVGGAPLGARDVEW
jgi:hypothetical protein